MNRRANVWRMVALGALAAAGVEGSIGFGLAFSPGWANGWPGGLSIHSVWSTGMSLLLGLLVLTTAISAITAIAWAAESRGPGGRTVIVGVLIGLILALTAAGAVTSGVRPGLRKAALEMWPGGYGSGPTQARSSRPG